MIRLPFNVTQASAETIIRLMLIGALWVGEDGIRVNEPGIYIVKGNKISPQTAKSKRGIKAHKYDTSYFFYRERK